MTFTRILVPVALSPSCAWAAQYAAQLARRFGSELLFTHVGNCPVETVEAFLAPAIHDAPHQVQVRQGDPAEAIVQLAHTTSPSLIVMPTHAHGRFRRFLLGSVTAKVLHDVDCPVLTGVHLENISLPARAEFHHIVCGIDCDDSFGPVIRGAIGFSSLVNAALTVVHAVPAVDETSDNPGEKEICKYLFRVAEERFARLKNDAQIEVAISLAGGSVSTVIRETALRVSADLVVIGRGHTQRSVGRLRTHAYAIIRNSPCPVLSL